MAEPLKPRQEALPPAPPLFQQPEPGFQNPAALLSFLQKLTQHLIHHDEHAGQVEGPLKGGSLGGGHGGLAVAAQIAVPLAIFGIAENALAVVQGLAEIKKAYPVSDYVAQIKQQRDAEIKDVFTGNSDKFIVIIGPCSADNEESVMDYIHRLAKVQDKVGDRLIIIPRIYTNKPRTTGEGYKGMVHQPDPEKKPDMLAGLIAIRKLHIRAVEETGLTAADEMLYPENFWYLADILSYVAIGARSVEDQHHRMTTSGMDVPAGMKNPTSGDFSVMLNSVVAAQAAQQGGAQQAANGGDDDVVDADYEVVDEDK